MLKLIIAGGRDFKEYKRLKKEVDTYLQDLAIAYGLTYNDLEIVSGKQVTKPDFNDEKTWHGADYLGEKYAEYYKIPVKPFPAEWNKYGKKAGVLRNEEMAKYANCLIAFWDGKSKGTANMIENAIKYSLPYKIIYY